jgi:hypothetical protein
MTCACEKSTPPQKKLGRNIVLLVRYLFPANGGPFCFPPVWQALIGGLFPSDFSIRDQMFTLDVE